MPEDPINTADQDKENNPEENKQDNSQENDNAGTGGKEPLTTENPAKDDQKPDTNEKPDIVTVFPTKFDLPNIPEVNPMAREKKAPKSGELPPLADVGFKLSKFILIIISGYIAFLVFYLVFMAFDNSDRIDITSQLNLTDSAFAKKLDLIKAVQDAHKSKRDFISQTSQMVLLNLLLPTLTAILGYIFGSREEAKKT